MQNGYGAPYVKVFATYKKDVDKKDIWEEVTPNITDFIYKYSQAEDDICQIKIEEHDTNLPDRPEFQEGVILKVTWGYIGHEDSKSRKVKIVNITPSYNENHITLDILCTDLASSLKNNSSKQIHQGNIVSIAKGVAAQHGVTYLGLSEDGTAIDVRDQVGDTHP